MSWRVKVLLITGVFWTVPMLSQQFFVIVIDVILLVVWVFLMAIEEVLCVQWELLIVLRFSWLLRWLIEKQYIRWCFGFWLVYQKSLEVRPEVYLVLWCTLQLCPLGQTDTVRSCCFLYDHQLSPPPLHHPERLLDTPVERAPWASHLKQKNSSCRWHIVHRNLKTDADTWGQLHTCIKNSLVFFSM